MSYAQNIAVSLQNFVSGFDVVANQYNFTMELPASLSATDLEYDPETNQLRPKVSASNNPLTVKMRLERDRSTKLQPEPGTNRELIPVKGNLVEPRQISRFPDTENGITANFLVAGVWRNCLLFDFQILPTAESEAMRADRASGLPVKATIQIQQGA